MEGESMEHTKGPWRVVAGHVASGHELVVASCPADNGNGVVRPNSTQCDANLRLIAAAPDLLEACKDALGFTTDKRTLGLFVRPGVTLEQALQNAIEKAEGN